MTKGTILFIGPRDREIELLVSRLQKEHFTIAELSDYASVSRWLRQSTPQAVLFTRRCPRKTIESCLSLLRSQRKTRSLPAILVTDGDVPSELTGIKGIGEAFKLHKISLAEALRRLQLAIQLCQLARA